MEILQKCKFITNKEAYYTYTIIRGVTISVQSRKGNIIPNEFFFKFSTFRKSS